MLVVFIVHIGVKNKQREGDKICLGCKINLVSSFLRIPLTGSVFNTHWKIHISPDCIRDIYQQILVAHGRSVVSLSAARPPSEASEAPYP